MRTHHEHDPYYPYERPSWFSRRRHPQRCHRRHLTSLILPGIIVLAILGAALNQTTPATTSPADTGQPATTPEAATPPDTTALATDPTQLTAPADSGQPAPDTFTQAPGDPDRIVGTTDPATAPAVDAAPVRPAGQRWLATILVWAWVISLLSIAAIIGIAIGKVAVRVRRRRRPPAVPIPPAPTGPAQWLDSAVAGTSEVAELERCVQWLIWALSRDVNPEAVTASAKATDRAWWPALHRVRRTIGQLAETATEPELAAWCLHVIDIDHRTQNGRP